MNWHKIGQEDSVIEIRIKKINHMKTFKSLVLFTGIVVGIVTLFTFQVHAEKNSLTRVEKKQIKIEKASMLTQLQETEDLLLQEYLQQVCFENEEATVAIYNKKGACVYEGEEASGKDLLKNCSYLFSFGAQDIYIIIE